MSSWNIWRKSFHGSFLSYACFQIWKTPREQLKCMGDSYIICNILISMLISKFISHLNPPNSTAWVSLWAAMFHFTLRVGILRKDLPKNLTYCPQTGANPHSPFFLPSFFLWTGSVLPLRPQPPSHIVWKVIHPHSIAYSLPVLMDSLSHSPSLSFSLFLLSLRFFFNMSHFLLLEPISLSS